MNKIHFYNRFGQLIFRRPSGKLAGHQYPQLSIQRSELHDILLTEVKKRIGVEKIHLGWRCTNVVQQGDHVIADFIDMQGNECTPQEGLLLIGCDGIHSKIRQIFYPNEDPSLYHGINMWRGVSKWTPFLSGASMLRIRLPKLKKYEEIRLFETAEITKIDRSMAQDRLLSETYIRTNDKPFSDIENIFSANELDDLSKPTYSFNELIMF